MRPDDGGERHSDDELARAMEAEVARLTAAIPVVAAPIAAGPEEREPGALDPDTHDPAAHDPAALSDAEVTALVDADLATRDTLAAIEHLESVLAARSLPSAAPDGAQNADDRDQDGGEDADASGPPTERISFDDLPVRREPAGPRPTFSAWVGAAAPPETARGQREGEPGSAADGEPETAAAPAPAGGPAPAGESASAEAPVLAGESGPAEAPALAGKPGPAEDPEPRPSPSPPPAVPTRAEPLGLVPTDLAPPDSQPVPLLAELPTTSAATTPATAHDLSVPYDLTTAHIPASSHVPTSPHAPAPAPDHPHTPTPVAPPRPPAPGVLVPEETGLGPTPLDRRVGRAARMFWLWFAGTSSLVSVGLGATLFSLGLSLRQLLVATLVGVGLSFLPLGLGTLAGKWSGQPTMVVSRAAFGLLGNAVPAALALVVKLFWGAVLLWIAGSAAGSLVAAEGWPGAAAAATAVALAVSILAATIVAFFGYGLVARVQLVLTVASAALIALTVAVTWPRVDLSRALAVPDALWTQVVAGAVLVFSYLGLAWAMSSAEVARYQRRTSSGAAAMLWATFGAAVPPFVLVSYGGLLAASAPGIAGLLARDPVRALTGLGLPPWFAAPLLLAVGLSLVSALVLTIYSGGFTLEALGVRLGRRRSTLAVGGAIALAGFALAVAVSDLGAVLRGVPTLSVPVAAWVGLFTGDLMLRTRRFHPPSLPRRGGAYPDWRWGTLAALVAATAIGLGLVSSPLPWLAWEGYLFRLLGLEPGSGLGASAIGVLVALAIGLATPVLSGLPAVRRQERAEVAAVAAG